MTRALAVLLVVTAAATPAHAKGCHEHSNVVGYQHCGHFGAWSPDDDGPLLWVDLGYLGERFDAPASAVVDGKVVHDGTSHVTAAAFVTRISGGWRLAPRLAAYVGGELAVGALPERPDILVGGLDRTSELFAAHAIVGLRAVAGRIGPAVEVAAGGRYDGVIACADTMCARDVYATGGRGELDARVRVDYWFASQGTIGIAVGQSLVDPSDRELLATLTIHSRVWDGL
jgi:hypothetical protein